MIRSEQSTAVELSNKEWDQVLSVMEFGIERLQSEDLVETAQARQSVHDEIESQVPEPEPGTLSGLLSVLEDEYDIDRSRKAEECGRQVAHLQD